MWHSHHKVIICAVDVNSVRTYGMKGCVMKKPVFIFAGLVSIGAFIIVPASADYIGGGSIHQNGKCWKDTGGGRDARYGVWIECPKTAGNNADCGVGQLAWEKEHVGQQYFDHCARGGAANSGKGAPQRVAR